MKEIKSCTSFIVQVVCPTICNWLEKHLKSTINWLAGDCPIPYKTTTKTDLQTKKLMSNDDPGRMSTPCTAFSGALSLTGAMRYTLDGRNPTPMVKKDFEVFERQDGTGLQLAILLSQSIRRSRHNIRDIKNCIPKASSSFEMELILLIGKFTHTPYHIIHS